MSCAGAGVGPRAIERVVGVVKAYTTRVGSGPFPTELFDGDEVGDMLVERGHEFGTNTGRRRRPGWLDLVMLQPRGAAQHVHRARDHEARRAVAAAPSSRCASRTRARTATRYDHVPYHQSVLHKVRPIYETLPGWQCDIERAERLEDLPAAARDYVQFIEKVAGVHVELRVRRPRRDQTVVLPRAA